MTAVSFSFAKIVKLSRSELVVDRQRLHTVSKIKKLPVKGIPRSGHP